MKNYLKSTILKKTPIVLIGDFLAIIFLIIILVRMQSVADQIKTVRSESASFTPVNIEAVKAEILKTKDTQTKLKLVFPKELELVDFINRINAIKSDAVLKNFSFPSDNIVRDKGGNIGLPILLSFSGKIDDINASLQKVNDLPFIIRAIDFKLSVSPDSSGSASLDYGGFLYVNENFKN